MTEQRPTPSRRRLVWFRVAALLLGLALGLLSVEVGLRLAGVQAARFITKRQLIDDSPGLSHYYHCYPDNPVGELTPPPDVLTGSWLLQDYTFEHAELPLSRLSETPWCVEYRHSSRGIRDREYEEPPPAGSVRLAVVGDSFVFGEGVPEDKTLPRQLKTALGPHVECVNAGQVGANVEQELAILQAVAPGAHCQAALLVLIPNDIPLTTELATRQNYINDLILVRDKYLERNRAWYHGRSRVLDLALTPWQMARVRRETIQWYLDSYDPKFNGTNLQRLQEQLSALKTSTPVPIGVILYPLMEGFESSYPLQPVHAALSKAASNAGLPVCDLAPAFQGQSAEALWVHVSDRHPNGTAHRLAAEAIAQWLRQEHPEWLQPPGGPLEAQP
ncbi:MAG: SGNH/GDSL hydrolase family protein [Planctomycetaceae bacterium]|nr:SGNH/GDSL hydrolase family protein [Planctomycetaceae bacterium]